jgi:cytochrome c-type biogenesis protein CcmH
MKRSPPPPSFQRKLESILISPLARKSQWIPACAGMTSLKRAVVALGFVLVLLAQSALAIDPLPFKDAAEEARFRALAAELRCVLCQNQSLADSNAGIAQDLRKEVFGLMREGKTDEEIKVFLTERYSDFVLYKPRMEPRTWLIWFGPAAVLLAGAVAVVVIVRRRARSAPAQIAPAPEEDW